MLFLVNRENEIHEQVMAFNMSVDVLRELTFTYNAILTSKQNCSLSTYGITITLISFDSNNNYLEHYNFAS